RTGVSRILDTVAQISASTAPSPARAHGYLALCYKREHAGQVVFDGRRATIINISPESDGIGDITQAGCSCFFKLAQQKSFIRCIWKKHLDRFYVCSGHGKNVGRTLD